MAIPHETWPEVFKDQEETNAGVTLLLRDQENAEASVKSQLANADTPVAVPPPLALPNIIPLPGAMPNETATSASIAANALEYNTQYVQPTQAPRPMRQPPAAARNKRKGVKPVPAMNTMTLEQLDTGYRANIPTRQEPVIRPTSMLVLMTDPAVFEKPSMPALTDAPHDTYILS